MEVFRRKERRKAIGWRSGQCYKVPALGAYCLVGVVSVLTFRQVLRPRELWDIGVEGLGSHIAS